MGQGEGEGGRDGREELVELLGGSKGDGEKNDTEES